MGDNTQLTEGQSAEFAYTDMNKAPEQHKTIAIQFAMGLPIDDISISTGYPSAYVEKILNHPPAIAYAEVMKKALDNQAVKLVGQWQSMLPKALDRFKQLMDSKSDTVALRAVTEYLDRERTLIFAKRKYVEGTGDNKILDGGAIDELKQNAAKLEGQGNGRKRSDESAREARYLEDGDAEEGPGAGISYPEPARFATDTAGADEDPGWPPADAGDGEVDEDG